MYIKIISNAVISCQVREKCKICKKLKNYIKCDINYEFLTKNIEKTEGVWYNLYDSWMKMEIFYA